MLVIQPRAAQTDASSLDEAGEAQNRRDERHTTFDSTEALIKYHFKRRHQKKMASSLSTMYTSTLLHGKNELKAQVRIRWLLRASKANICTGIQNEQKDQKGHCEASHFPSP